MSHIMSHMEQSQRWRRAALIMFLIYMIVLFLITIGSRSWEDATQIQLRLFWSYRQAYKTGRSLYVITNLENVLLFVPLGISLGGFFKGRRFGLAVGISALVSMLIEVIQLLTHRGWLDVDDIFHNVLGAAVGFGVMWSMKKMKERMKRR